MKKAIIIGGGFGGCCPAQLLSEKGWDVTLVEKGSFIGGGCKTLYYGGHPYTFGPRHFLTKKEELFNFLNKYTPMKRIPDHEFLTYVEQDESFYNYPINVADIDKMPDKEKINKELETRKGVEDAQNLEEFWIRSVGKTLYDKFVNDYSKKMWQVESNSEIDDFSWSPKGVTIKKDARAAWTEAISAFPYAPNGYDDYFKIATQNTKVHLNTLIDCYDLENSRIKIGEEWHKYDVLVSSVSPEIIMNNAFGPLRWIGRDFMKIVLPVKEVFPKNVYFLYYANKEPFTRIVEYKKFFLNDKDSTTTLIGLEIPSLNGGKLYPMPTSKDKALAKKYFDAMPSNVFSIGRAGSYDYRIDIDDCIEQSLDFIKKVER